MKFHAIPNCFHWLLLFGHNPLCSSPQKKALETCVKCTLDLQAKVPKLKHLSHNAAYREQTRLIQIQIWSCGYIQILFYQSNCWDILISSQAVQECVCSSICFFLNTNNITQTVSNIIRVEFAESFSVMPKSRLCCNFMKSKAALQMLAVAKTGCFNPPEQIGVSRKKHP